MVVLLSSAHGAPAVAQRGTDDESGGVLSDVAELLLGPGPPTTPPQAPTPGTTPPAPDPATTPPGRPGAAPAPEPQAAPPPERSPLGGALSLLDPLLSGSPLPIVAPGSPAESVAPGPGRIWTLTASQLALTGIRYHGHAQREVAGRLVTTLHFTIDRAEIRDLVVRGVLGNGKNLNVRAQPGSTSNVEGPFEFYTQELVGTLLIAGVPVVRLRLSPETLPDIDLSAIAIPGLTFADAVARNTDLVGGDLSIPDVRIGQE